MFRVRQANPVCRFYSKGLTLMFSNKKIGGIRFIRVGRVSIQVSIRKNAELMTTEEIFAAAVFSYAGIASAIVMLASRGII